jgi:multiple sugar transport system ATP-binding protein
LVHFHVNGTKICARCDPDITSGHGDVLPMSADLNNMHLIDTESGRVV